MDDLAKPKPLKPSKRRYFSQDQRGCLAGCVTLLAGFFVSNVLAAIAVRNEPENTTEIYEAMYWDGIRFEWCCGGGIIALILSFLVVMWVLGQKPDNRS
jgi:hypothetical protein